eukprot:CAMPEP_0181441760 /NCGR_PEP_ID=MMETSP1110-20121109/23675_1 /TAXON_ID=174948 /ORGANISM="Symbiodinium sp., Strain CCMP421" /LENGTH=78 /DNA_ID=CAMNT_0023565657 /DNA_START=217 /DNA_END=451 /DNA_ORIENTATION=-
MKSPEGANSGKSGCSVGWFPGVLAARETCGGFLATEGLQKAEIREAKHPKEAQREATASDPASTRHRFGAGPLTSTSK